MSNYNTSNAPQGDTARLVVYWAIVGIPLIWGVLKTLSNALALFQ
jgi:hypothetical protein